MRPFLAALALPAAAAFAPRLSAFGGGASLSADAAAARTSPLRASLEAILFDCDGVLADTERDGHRPAFNIAFKENGIAEEWGEERYGKLLEVGGGKERMTAHWVSIAYLVSFARCTLPSVATVICLVHRLQIHVLE